MSAMPQLPAPNEPDRPRPLVAARVMEAAEERQAAPPHPLGPLRPAVISWPIVLLFLALFAGGAYYVGTTRDPTYTATSSFNVGRTDVRVQALPGFVEGAQQLAASYSRVAISDAIVRPTARRTGLT